MGEGWGRDEAAKVLVLLQYFLGGIGKFKFYIGDNNIIHIKYIVFDKNDIINVIKPYFSLIYGEKQIAFIKLERIHQIITDPSNINKNLTYELINLVYGLNPDGNNPKLSIKEKLDLFNCNDLTYKQETPVYESDWRSREPDILFIIGLFIGDGSLYYSIYENKTSKFKFSLKIICEIVSLKNNDSNELLINLIIKNLEAIKSNLKQTQSSLKIKSEKESLAVQLAEGSPKTAKAIYISKKNQRTLRYSGSYVFKYILPVL